MRVISGTLRGRYFDSPQNRRTHPMSQQIKNAVFNSLGNIRGITLLDAYSGSGAVAFEATSRGADKVYAIEKNPKVFKVLKTNRDILDLENKVEVSRANCVSWLKQNKIMFDVIIVDPPFDQFNLDTIDFFAQYLQPGGILVLSHASHEEIILKNFKHLSENVYGNAQISFYKPE